MFNYEAAYTMLIELLSWPLCCVDSVMQQMIVVLRFIAVLVTSPGLVIQQRLLLGSVVSVRSLYLLV